MAFHNIVGTKGEEAAIMYLCANGYTILHTKWVWNKKEADIIASKDNQIVFVEVKTRTDLNFGDPKKSVTLQKQRNLIHVANAYVLKYNLNSNVRFDIIVVSHNAYDYYVEEHVIDAFYPLVR